LSGNDQECLLLAAALEQHSEHPIASAFKSLKFTELPTVDNIHNEAGFGLMGTINGKAI
jgi:Cu2+-exporting ATPase